MKKNKNRKKYLLLSMWVIVLLLSSSLTAADLSTRITTEKTPGNIKTTINGTVVSATFYTPTTVRIVSILKGIHFQRKLFR